ncbi:39S ribosomal protein L49, mitochondrial [Oopsacas minuta]|uniref:Large ribosomal subunit protein mL49 n=1 Tax=Oopsacas minuta TaxID=111878 RepID=A0AAV7K604_9METZ|nr:39S ribosomal protein L49, mitochondrial [Oopsacas minuta]
MLSHSLRKNFILTGILRVFLTRLNTSEPGHVPSQLDYTINTIDNDSLPPFTPKTPSGWQPPNPCGPIVKNLPFHIFRSRTNNLPVYSRFRAKGPKVNTVIRRIAGDKSALVAVLVRVLGSDRITEVDIREGKINLRGNRVEEIMKVLYRMGF